MLSDGSIVHFAPPAIDQIGNLLQVGQAVTATGYGTQNRFGMALEASTFGTIGQQPMTLYGPGPLGGPAGGPRRSP